VNDIEGTRSTSNVSRRDDSIFYGTQNKLIRFSEVSTSLGRMISFYRTLDTEG